MLIQLFLSFFNDNGDDDSYYDDDADDDIDENVSVNINIFSRGATAALLLTQTDD